MNEVGKKKRKRSWYLPELKSARFSLDKKNRRCCSTAQKMAVNTLLAETNSLGPEVLKMSAVEPPGTEVLRRFVRPRVKVKELSKMKRNWSTPEV